MSRVIAGVAGGRRLVVPVGGATRPTSDRAREGLFSTLTSLRGSLDGASFLDLYAGSGAVGLEAASRGATRVLMVERDPKALRAVRANIDTLALPGVELRGEPVERALAAVATAAYDVVFLDPPYTDPVDTVLEQLADGGWLAEDAVICVERASRGGAPAWPAGIEPLRSRRYGEATLWYGRRS
jgi:16S rRNA (guanine966-N2)-methyltransferase